MRRALSGLRRHSSLLLCAVLPQTSCVRGSRIRVEEEPALDAMDFIAFVEKEFGRIRPGR